jgi:hypothetical protein
VINPFAETFDQALSLRYYAFLIIDPELSGVINKKSQISPRLFSAW